MSEDCWTTTVTILLVLYFIILSFWNLYTCLVFTCLLSWVNNLTFKASAEPRFNPFAVADHCLSLYNSLQEGMSTAFYAFFTFSQSDLIFFAPTGALYVKNMGTTGPAPATGYFFRSSLFLTQSSLVFLHLGGNLLNVRNSSK